MTTIYLIRHAEAEGNLCRRIHGHFDTNITPNGMNQIRDLAVRFADVPIDACYCSDLTRTRTTAQAVYLQKGLILQPDPAFREVYLGRWEDVPFGYLYAREEDSINRFCRQPELWSTEGSETYAEYTSRFLTALDKAVQAHPNQSIAIVSHGAVLRGVLHVLFPEVEIAHADNTAVTCLTCEEGRYTLQYLNDNSHLKSGNSLFARQTWWKKKSSGNDGTIWFREGAVSMEGCASTVAQLTYTAYCGEEPIGYVCLDEEGKNGRITDMALIPSYRSRDLSIQLLGQGLFKMRALNKKKLLLRVPEGNIPMECLTKKLDFQKTRSGDLALDLSVGVIPLR